MGSIKVFTHPNATSYFYVKTRSFIFSEEMPSYPTTVVWSRGHLHPLRSRMILQQLLLPTSSKPSTTHKGVYSPECTLSYAINSLKLELQLQWLRALNATLQPVTSARPDCDTSRPQLSRSSTSNNFICPGTQATSARHGCDTSRPPMSRSSSVNNDQCPGTS